MKRTIFLAIAVIIIVLVGYIAYLMLTTRNHSPADTIKYDADGLTMSITYCRPFKKGRMIFGTKEEGALQPYGEYWRTGANEATEVTFEQNVVFNGESLDAGTYRFYTVPGEKEWEVSLNSELGVWGYSEPNYQLDVLKSNVLADKLNEPVEQFTIEFDQQGDHVNILLAWDNAKVKIPVSPAN